MAALPSLSHGPVPFKAAEEEHGHPAPRRADEYDDLISGLPCLQLWVPLRLYQGFWLPENTLPGGIAIQRHFKPRPDDVLLATYPKSGTTWLKALLFAAMTRARYPLADHPLLRLSPHDCVAYMDEVFAVSQASKVEALPSPRILATHMPRSVLPDSVVSSGCRIIYVCRDPKDVLVSIWHVARKMLPVPVPFEQIYEVFCQGSFPYGPIWGHVLEYWKESLRRPEQVLFLQYEEMLEDPVRSVKRLAEFVGCPFSEEEEKGGVAEEIVRLCSIENLRDLEVNKTGSQGTVFKVANASFFRKGVAGDWRNHMSLEMAERLDGIAQQQIKGSGLSLPRASAEAKAALPAENGVC